MHELSTKGLRVRDRLPKWNHIARTVAPINVEARGSSPFEAKLIRHPIGDLEFVWVCSSPAYISSAESFHRPRYFNLFLQLAGSSVNHVNDTTNVIEEGDLILYDPSKPHWMSFDDRNEAIIIQMPAAIALSRVPSLNRLVGTKISGRRGTGALLSSFLTEIWGQLKLGHSDWGEPLQNLIWQFVEVVSASKRTPELATTRREERRQEVFAAVELALSNPNLGARAIARRLGVSVRYVQMLFADMGTTPGNYIQNCRLQLAARLLEEGNRHVAITNIAYDVGFNDLSGFCRAFRKKFGVAPNQYRSGLRNTG